MNIQKLIIEDVRCFAGRQEFRIRPLTFLVGENSTGKSTALGCYQILADYMSSPRWYLRPDFNIDPYRMGAFADIVRRARPPKESFQIGFGFQGETERETAEYLLTLAEKERGSEPVVREQKLVSPDSELVFREKTTSLPGRRSDFSDDLEVAAIVRIGEKKKFFVDSPHVNRGAFFLLSSLYDLFEDEDQETLSPGKQELQQSLRENPLLSLEEDLPLSAYDVYGVFSFAPIRSRPQRTYNPLKEETSPEGGEVPMVLMNMARAEKENWRELKERLLRFGKASGLFSDIGVRRLGKSAGDPFQLQVRVKGPRANLMDTGYGVSQLLPVLVRIFNADMYPTFLIQQPEVHLHPTGQAELASLMIDMTREREHNFVVETHSDYMVDRARIEIMNGRIAPGDVSLIYLEAVGRSVKVHNIAFDERANLLGAPPGYKRFFLKESDRLLGVD